MHKSAKNYCFLPILSSQYSNYNVWCKCLLVTRVLMRYDYFLERGKYMVFRSLKFLFKMLSLTFTASDKIMLFLRGQMMRAWKV